MGRKPEKKRTKTPIQRVSAKPHGPDTSPKPGSAVDLDAELFDTLAAIARPPERLDLCAWLEKHRRLSPEASAEPGPFEFARIPYGREITRAIGDPATREVVVRAASQVAKSELCTLNPILRWAIAEPAPMLLVCPTLQAARSMSLDRIDPMLRDAVLEEELLEERTQGPRAENSIFHKRFKNGCRLSIVGGLSAAGLAMRPIKYLVFEEVSRLPLMAMGPRATEGDVLLLAKVRTSTFGAQAKVVYSSSPVELESCRVSALFEDSTQEYWYSKCPRGHLQILGLSEMNFETGCCRCLTCGLEYDQASWQEEEGQWRAHATHAFRRGFHLACWPSPFIDWGSVHAEWRSAAHLAREGDTSALRAVLNTRLGEPFVMKRDKLSTDALLGRREVYPAEVPPGVKVLVAGIDTQDSYFAYLVFGAGPGRELWLLEYGRIEGVASTDTGTMYTDVDRLILDRLWIRGDGKKMKVRRALQDAGGHYSTIVLAETKRRHSRLMAYRGNATGQGLYRIVHSSSPVRTSVVTANVNLAKDLVAGLLKVENAGRGFVHVPGAHDGSDVRGFDKEFYAQLGAESREPVIRNGIKGFVWKKNRARNEALDCLVMGLVALESLRMNLDEIAPLTVDDRPASAEGGSQSQPVPRYGVQPGADLLLAEFSGGQYGVLDPRKQQGLKSIWGVQEGSGVDIWQVP